jgi:glycosyltransferase involved in cell wall biosynthesis
VQRAAATSLLVLLSYLFRAPPLLNARSTNSDAAVVGLQAMHVLHGERSPFLWGSGYQTSADAFVAAGFFAVLGPTPLALMLSALTLHVIATWLVFATLRRRLAPWTALLLSLPLVVAPSSIHTYALYPPRQLSITLAVAALWALDGAAMRVKRSEAWLAAGATLYGLALVADPYPMVLAPIVLGYGLLVALERPRRRLPVLVSGAVAGLVPFALLRASAGARSGPLGLTTSVIGHNWDLLVRECLPWALSYKVYYARNVMDYHPWEAPRAVHAVQITGAIVVALLVIVGLSAILFRNIPLRIRRLGFAGAMTYPVAISAFLASVMVMDHFSMRYLAVLTLMLPFAALPAAHLLGTRRIALVLAPHLVASAIGGWVGYGPFVRGFVPVLETPELRDDYALLDLLRARGITYAEADYWASYRLTFLFQERIVVVPTNPGEDRYAPYRRAFEAAPVFAYVFDPGRSRENLAETETRLAKTYASVEKTQAGGHTVFVVTRTERRLP